MISFVVGILNDLCVMQVKWWELLILFARWPTFTRLCEKRFARAFIQDLVTEFWRLWNLKVTRVGLTRVGDGHQRVGWPMRVGTRQWWSSTRREWGRWWKKERKRPEDSIYIVIITKWGDDSKFYYGHFHHITSITSQVNSKIDMSMDMLCHFSQSPPCHSVHN